MLATSAGEPNWIGRPSVVTLADGTVVMAYRTGETHTTADALHIRFSDDYGATWSDEDKTLVGDAVAGFPISWAGGYIVGEPRLYLAPNGRLILHFWKHIWASDMQGTYQSVSDDNGATWSEPAAVTFVGYEGEDVFYTTDDYFVYDGVIYAGGREPTDPSETSIRCVFVKSTDNGDSWDYVSIIGTTCSEVGLEYLGNNTIIAILRAKSNNHTYRTFSTDMGATWSALTEISYIVPWSGRHRLWTKTHLQGGATWWTDDNLLMCGFEFITGGTRRSFLAISRNGGQWWDAPLYVDSAYADAGYGEVFYNPIADEYVFLCYRGTTEAADLVQYNISVNFGSG